MTDGPGGSDPGAEQLVAFGRALRAAGMAVGTGRINDFCRATALLKPEDLYWAGRGTLVGRREEIPVYNRVYAAFFGEEAPAAVNVPTKPTRVRAGSQGDPDPGSTGEQDVQPELLLASTIERLKEKSFARCTAEELALLSALMETIRLAVPQRRSRRRQRARSGSPDLRRTIRRSFRTGGEPIERSWRERRKRRRRLVLFLDVSGSMAAYSRALLVFAYAALRADPRWEAYCFGTRLTRLTRVLGPTNPDAALRAGRGRGVRLGRRHPDRRVAQELPGQPGRGRPRRGLDHLLRRARGRRPEPARAAQMARLSRLAYRVIWLNPLKEDPAYEPLARGMAASLPYIDLFVSGHNLAGLESLSDDLARM